MILVEASSFFGISIAVLSGRDWSFCLKNCPKPLQENGFD